MCADTTLQLSKVQERKACLLSDQQKEQSALAALRVSSTAVCKPLLRLTPCMIHSFVAKLLQRNTHHF